MGPWARAVTPVEVNVCMDARVTMSVDEPRVGWRVGWRVEWGGEESDDR